MKESIIKISKPLPKVHIQQEESELQSSSTQRAEISLSEELLEPEPESTDIAQPASVRFGSTHSNGWKVSDILREIRLDNFEIDGVD